MINDTPTTTSQYRGYTLVTNSLGTDVWWRGDYVATRYGENSFAQATALVDEWHNAR